jgi:1-acyl-sn-glycerol-3-phosphate acyltransferase
VKQTFESRGAAIRRRLVTIPRLFLLFIVLTVLAPLWIPLALIVDVARWLKNRTPFMAIRMLAFGWVYFALSTIGVIGFFITWVAAGFGRNDRVLLNTAYAIQRWWGASTFRVASFILGLKTTVTGQEALDPPPIILLFRHASIVDNLLPLVFVMGDPYRVRIRWLIKRELMAEAALDIGGKRLPNYFVNRRGKTADEVAAIRRLATDLGHRGGVMIFPEGTRFSPEKRRRALARIKVPAAREAAEKLQHTLPPRPAGTLAALDGAPDADVVIAAHVGLDGLASLGDIWNGSITGRHIYLDFRRVPRSEVPTDRAGRITWLMTQWQQVDDWIGRRRDG